MDKNTIIGLICGAILSYLIPKVSPYIDKGIKHFFNYLLNTIFKPLKGYFRKKRLQKLQDFRVTRKNDSAVTMQIISAYAYLILFWGIIIFYINLLIQTEFSAILEKNFVFGMFLTTPIYLFEIYWLRADKKARALVKNRGKLGL